MEFKTYILKKTGEFFTLDIDNYRYVVDGYTSNIPFLYPYTHTKDYLELLKQQYSSFIWNIDINHLELITVKVEKI